MNVSSELTYVAGHTGLVGSAVLRALARRGHVYPPITRSRGELDLRCQADVREFFFKERPHLVILAAATVGGIMANSTRPAEFIYDNAMIAANVVDAAYRSGSCRKLVMLGSSCIYPRDAAQPIQESALLTGPLEPTNRAYAVAKIAGMELARAYRTQYGFRTISLMPTNLYGPGDNYDLRNSHVLPAMIRKFHDAKRLGADTVTLWGTGAARREFLHVDDLADALLTCVDWYDSDEPLNIGTGEDVTIAELAEVVAQVVGYDREILFDATKPDGTPRKVLDVSRVKALGWSPKIGLDDGIRRTYEAFVEDYASEVPCCDKTRQKGVGCHCRCPVCQPWESK